MFANKSCLFVVLMWTAAISAEAGTLVQGPVSGTWNLAGSPYCVTNNVFVFTSLTIDPGVEIQFQGNHQFNVNLAATLTAIGTESSPILFGPSPTNTTGWTGIRFQSTHSGFAVPVSRMRHCSIRGANDSAVRIIDGDPILENCVIEDSSSLGNGGGIDIQLSAGSNGPLLTKCTIRNNSAVSMGGGISVIATNNSNQVPGIEKCVIFANSAKEGGGLNVQLANGGKTLLVLDSHILSNTSSSHGGGVRSDIVAPDGIVFRGCSITDNMANPTNSLPDVVGGGFRSSGGLTLEDTVVASNIVFADQHAWHQNSIARGGGIWASAGAVELVRCQLVGNVARSNEHGLGGNETAWARGGGLFLASGAMMMTNCFIGGNLLISGGTKGCTQGCGVYVEAGSADIVNSTIARNSTQILAGIKACAGSDETGLAVVGGSSVTVLNSIVAENTVTTQGTEVSGTPVVSYSAIEGALFAGLGNINSNPKFVGTGYLGGELALAPGSPCIDSGDPSQGPDCDGSLADMGATGGALACQGDSPGTLLFNGTPQGKLASNQPFNWKIVAPGEAGHLAVVFLSCVGTQGFKIGPGLSVPLTLDGCVQLTSANYLFFSGVVSPQDVAATPVLSVPGIPPGVTLYAAAVTFDTQNYAPVSAFGPISLVTE